MPKKRGETSILREQRIKNALEKSINFLDQTDEDEQFYCDVEDLLDEMKRLRDSKGELLSRAARLGNDVRILRKKVSSLKLEIRVQRLETRAMAQFR
jgi:uncharacterized protein (UPF0335 family)